MKEESGLSMNRCVLCGKYPALTHRYVKRDGIYSSVWCICREHETEHEIRLVGKSVESLVASWNTLNTEFIELDMNGKKVERKG